MKKLLIAFALVLCAIFLIPLKSSGNWMDRAISRDFKRYEKAGISKEMIEASWANKKDSPGFLRYQIIDSKIYGPDSNVKVLLEEIIAHYPVPDVDFIYYNEDRLTKDFFKRTKNRNAPPIFVSAKHRSIQHVALFADWNYNIRRHTEGWNFYIQKVQENYAKWDWSQKLEKLFWRGMPWDGKHFGMYSLDNWTTIPRGRLVAESRKHPDWIDASFSELPYPCVQQDLNRSIAEMGPVQFVPWEEILHYKYQVILDGVTCSFPAAQWKLLSGSVCFKQESEDIQYWYDELVAWKHYIPIKNDLSDLEEKFLWAKRHDAEARQIAENAREFALTHLMPEQILLYCHKVLCKYASLQKFQPSLN